ncbi:(deoxy)nucleoside triphosphate pyrophosphohydrolase [Geotalea sp. SG265]|uniref:(deoxy)nucleoside triphosphate pyrophosphohydrolase n=1 Tax=Geotalea sp. SG265 TaxID=2922867 RepID=UPI001FAEA08C|nr:(deoxy)nucleoside triphosphate pyrophosphohydrolase [Geotalea sp. SG265]
MNQRIARHIHVTCAIVERDGLILAAQRSATMNQPLKWEFPGGKIDPGETPEACLQRELMEELAVAVSVCAPLQPVTHSYPDCTVTLYPFICTIEGGELILNEHAAVRWLKPEELPNLDWAAADLPVVHNYLRVKSEG